MKRQKLVGGGYLQRLAADDAVWGSANPLGSALHNTRRSQLADILMHDVLWGYLPSSRAAKIARAAVADGVRHPDLVRMASCGSTSVGQIRNAWKDWKGLADAKPELLRAVGVASVVGAAGAGATGVVAAAVGVVGAADGVGDVGVVGVADAAGAVSFAGASGVAGVVGVAGFRREFRARGG